MSKVKFELNRAGVRELMQSQEALAICKSYAESISSRVGDGYEVSTHIGKTRANASVYAASKEAREDNYENNTLLKALGSTR